MRLVLLGLLITTSISTGNVLSQEPTKKAKKENKILTQQEVRNVILRNKLKGLTQNQRITKAVQFQNNVEAYHKGLVQMGRASKENRNCRVLICGL